MQHTDTLFRTFCQAGAVLALLLIAGIFGQLFIHSADAWQHFGLPFLWGSNWDPAVDDYGALPHLLGTLLTTLISLLLAVPLSFAVALLITETPDWLNRPLSHCVDLLAAIPSVIYGMWGLFAGLCARHRAGCISSVCPSLYLRIQLFYRSGVQILCY